MKIALLNQKGGTGKTTLSIHIAAALASSGRRVLLIDADLQHSALDWQAAREGESVMTVVGLPTRTLHKEIARLAAGFDDIVIDGPPRVNDVAKSAIAAADVVLIPVQPSPYDVWAAKEIVDLIDEVRVLKPEVRAVFVVNRKIVNTAIGRDVVGALAGYDLPVLRSTIGQRVTFAESAATGSTVMELDPNGRAAGEVDALVGELLEVMAWQKK
jgi:chromosome partitioning protein